MNGSNLQHARDHFVPFLAALRAAHKDAIDSDDQFAVIVLLDLLRKAHQLEPALNEALQAAFFRTDDRDYMRFTNEVLSKLTARGISASWEHPGYIRVTLASDSAYLAIGDANGPWNVDVVTDHGGVIDESGALELPRTASVEQVADMIEKTTKEWNAKLTNVVQRIADDFDIRLKTAIGDIDYVLVLEANAAEKDANICHSHDYCDANEVMAEAFKYVTGRNVETQNDADTKIWNDAWATWKADRRKGGAS